MVAFWSEFEAGKGLTWALELKATGTCVGTCGYGEVRVGDWGEVGFDLDKRYWGQGLMAEALAAVIDYGFEHLKLTRVEAHSYSTNVRALRLLEKLGFHVEHISDDSHYLVMPKLDWGQAQS
jgi:ribosomal-protein-alanine N-acetyltransferase